MLKLALSSQSKLVKIFLEIFTALNTKTANLVYDGACSEPLREDTAWIVLNGSTRSR